MYFKKDLIELQNTKEKVKYKKLYANTKDSTFITRQTRIMIATRIIAAINVVTFLLVTKNKQKKVI